jgi:hypothetical protein
MANSPDVANHADVVDVGRGGKMRMTPEDIEIRVWAFIVISIMSMLFIIAVGILWAVTFEKQDSALAPIDAIFLEILKAVAYMSIGTLGGIAGRKVSKKAGEIFGEVK